MKKFTSIMLALLMVIAMSVTSFGVTEGYVDGGAIPETAGPLVTGDDGNNSKDLPVGITYTYEEGEAAAVKTYYVTLEYLFPAALTAIETEVAYVWDAENGKYVKETPAEEKQEEPTKEEPKDGEKTVNEEPAPADSNTYTLDNGGLFEIKLTNQSNVDVSYDVSYNKDEDAVFDSEAAFSKEENEGSTGKIATVASTDYQRVYEDSNDITITDSDLAQTGKGDTPFNAASCKGNLSVTGINAGKEPGATGSDTLGNFHIVINDATENVKITVADILPNNFPDTKGMSLPEDFKPWVGPNNAILYADSNGKDYLYITGIDEATFGTTVVHFPLDSELIGDEAIGQDQGGKGEFTLKFTGRGDKLTKITLVSEKGSCEFTAPVNGGDDEEDEDPAPTPTIASSFDSDYDTLRSEAWIKVDVNGDICETRYDTTDGLIFKRGEVQVVFAPESTVVNNSISKDNYTLTIEMDQEKIKSMTLITPDEQKFVFSGFWSDPEPQTKE